MKTWTLGCLFSAPSYKADGGEEHPALAEAMAMVAEAADVQKPLQPLTDRQRSLHWAGQFGLYRQLLTDEDLRHSDEALSAHFMEQDAGNIGRLHRAMEEFQAMRADGLDGYSAENMSLAGGITSDLLPEQRLAEVMGILHANITDLRALSEQDEARLKQIAQMCPFSDCGAVPSPEEFKTDGVQDTEATFRAYPNPSNGVMQIDYVLKEGENGMLSVFSVVGQLLLQRQLDPSQSRLTLDMNTIGSGTYLLRVDVNGEQQLMQKINIVK